MKQILTITRKELRGYFGSPMAMIFIGAFLIATLFSFFWVDTFFARGIADVRPLFRWMPVLMIFIAAALTMRQWSEEQRVGTLEILLTLPVSTTQLVIGKFLAVLVLIGIALGLTLFIPITVALLGNRRVPPALPVVGIGIAYALFSGTSRSHIGAGFGFTLPALHQPAWSDVLAGFLLLTIPQLPLSLSNSVIATERVVRDLFPARAVGMRKIGLTYSAINLVSPFFSGIPCCHGCGGLAGHYAFGARTGGSVVIYGAFFALTGLFLSGAASSVVQLFPQPMLGVILLFEALALMALVRDVAGSRADASIALLVGVIALGLPNGYLVGVLVGTALHYAGQRLGVLRGPEAAGPGAAKG